MNLKWVCSQILKKDRGVMRARDLLTQGAKPLLAELGGGPVRRLMSGQRVGMLGLREKASPGLRAIAVLPTYVEMFQRALQLSGWQLCVKSKAAALSPSSGMQLGGVLEGGDRRERQVEVTSDPAERERDHEWGIQGHFLSLLYDLSRCGRETRAKPQGHWRNEMERSVSFGA